MNELNDKFLAVLIDADNISYKNIKNMLVEITRYGTPTIKRIYGDWTKPELVGWKGALLENAITPVQQYGYTSGKNSTDSAMIIDAMDILYTGSVDGFCLVSSDSDFTRLAVRLREAGKIVYGIGEKKTPVAFIAACSKFIYLEILGQSAPEPENGRPVVEEVTGGKAPQTAPPSKPPVNAVSKEVRAMLSSTVSDLADEDGWANLSALGTLIIKKQPDFDPRNFGYPRLSPFLRSLGQFEFEERSLGNSRVKHLYLRNKQIVKQQPRRRKATPTP